MEDTLRFRRRLAARLARIASFVVLAGPGAVACSGNVTVLSGAAGVGGSSGVSGDSGGPTTITVGEGPSVGAGGPNVECFMWPQPGDACNSGTGGVGGFGDGGAGGVGNGGADGQPTCPAQECAFSYLMGHGCGVVGILGPGKYEDGECCYQVESVSCMSGRPFLLHGHVVTAPLVATEASGWCGERAPRIGDLSPAARDALADAWSSDALLEHASVASFGRFALELLAVGAPAELVESAHRAALDEIRHARLCFGLAKSYAPDRAGAPGAFPFGGAVDVSSDLASLASRAVIEGCVGETIAAVRAAEQRARAVDPAVRDVLDVIAEDEARHAELAWRAVAWAVGTGGQSVRAAVSRAFAEAMTNITAAPSLPEGIDASEVAAHGLLSPVALHHAFERSIAEIVAPASAILLGDGETRRRSVSDQRRGAGGEAVSGSSGQA